MSETEQAARDAAILQQTGAAASSPAVVKTQDQSGDGLVPYAELQGRLSEVEAKVASLMAKPDAPADGGITTADRTALDHVRRVFGLG